MLQFANPALEALTIRRSGMVLMNTIGAVGNQFTLVNDLLYLCPIWVSRPINIDALQIWFINAAGSGSTYRVGLWRSDENGLPSGIIAQSGLLSANITGQQNFLTNQTLQPGMYWFGLVSHGVSGVNHLVQGLQSPYMPSVHVGAGNTTCGFQVAGITSVTALPATPSTSTTQGVTTFRCGLRMS